MDEILNGGIRVGSLRILNAPSISGRELITQKFFYEGLSLEEGGTYVTTKNFTEDVIESMGERGWNLNNYGNRYVFVDPYSIQSDPTLKDTENIKYVSAISDFAKLSNTIVSSMGDFLNKGIYQQRLSFDSIDTLLMYVSANGVYRFLSYLRAKIKAFKSAGMFLLESGLHEEKAVKTILQIADVLIDLSPNKSEISVTTPGGFKNDNSNTSDETICKEINMYIGER